MRIESTGLPPHPAPSGSSVITQAQGLLRELTTRDADLPVTGELDERTRDALLDLQRRKGLPETGSADPATLDALEREAAWLRHERASVEAPLESSLHVAPQRTETRPTPSLHADVLVQLLQDRVSASTARAERPLSDLELARAIYAAVPFLPTLPGVSQHQLAHALRRLPPNEARAELESLQRASASPRLAGAYRTYFASIGSTPPVPPQVRRALVDGVVTPRRLFDGDTAGVLTGDQALLIAQVWRHLPASVQRSVSSLLSRASSGTERAMILEAVGARWQDFRRGDMSQLTDIVRFADEIRGVSSDALVRATTLVDRDRIEVDGSRTPTMGIMQRGERACTQIVELVVRAEADPVFAWDVTRRLPHLGAMPHAVPANELEDPEVVLRTAHGGPWNVGRFAPAMDEFARVTNRTYVTRSTTHPEAENRILALLDQGVQVPLTAQWTSSGGSHAIVAAGVRGQGAAREARVFDPSTGRGAWVALRDLVSGAEISLGGHRARVVEFYDSEIGRQDDVSWNPNGLGGRSLRPLTEPLR